MPRQRFNIDELRARFGEHGLNQMRHNLRVTAQVVDDIEQAMLRDGRLVIDVTGEKGIPGACYWGPSHPYLAGKRYNLT